MALRHASAGPGNRLHGDEDRHFLLVFVLPRIVRCAVREFVILVDGLPPSRHGEEQ